MFDTNFSFAPSASSSLDANSSAPIREPSRSVSPCSPTGPYPPHRFSVTDLATAFASSRLRTDSQICYDSCEAYANLDDAGWEVPCDDSTQSSVESQPLSHRPYSSATRSQRQANTRLLYTKAHAKDLSTLVAHMVGAREQCTVHPSDSSSSPPELDEGYTSSDATSAASESRTSSVTSPRAQVNYRRSFEFKTSAARVCKPVQVRKRKQPK